MVWAARADGCATLEIAGQRVPVRVDPVADSATIDAVHQAFFNKSADRAYANGMVAAETLGTTLRLVAA